MAACANMHGTLVAVVNGTKHTICACSKLKPITVTEHPGPVRITAMGPAYQIYPTVLSTPQDVGAEYTSAPDKQTPRVTHVL
jgi:hypothetical protein